MPVQGALWARSRGAARPLYVEVWNAQHLERRIHGLGKFVKNATHVNGTLVMRHHNTEEVGLDAIACKIDSHAIVLHESTGALRQGCCAALALSTSARLPSSRWHA